ncbi:hypothetical protein [Enterovibrio norvegicus]|uniref:hypothetical protein n=1 Tax=Enterovibrio norvegicus TaxID=188144 RepID=UPI0013D7A42D|nr:hypothetical protein [Enterovibrio norvegicus]
MALKNYDSLLDIIKKFKNKELSFQELAKSMRGMGSSVGYDLNYQGDFGNLMDVWMELIEFCYDEDEWYELGLSACDFIEGAILNEPRPLTLPRTDRVLIDQGLI